MAKTRSKTKPIVENLLEFLELMQPMCEIIERSDRAQRICVDDMYKIYEKLYNLEKIDFSINAVWINIATKLTLKTDESVVLKTKINHTYYREIARKGNGEIIEITPTIAFLTDVAKAQLEAKRIMEER